MGRESELGDISQLLDRSRLITLIGPGGTGKTRLALAAAQTAGASFPAGVATRLGAPDTPGQDPVGSGAQGHPNKGYELLPWGQYVNENFPGSVQTQVTGLNDNGVTVGFWSTMNTASMTNNNFGFYEAGGRFHSVNFPTGDNASPPVDQLLGVNDHGVAVGFSTNGQGSNRGYEYNIYSHKFTRVLVPGAPGGQAGPSLTAAAINNHGDVAGTYAASGGATDAFLRLGGGKFIKLAVPGASMTQAFGVNDSDEVVGFYTDSAGNTDGMIAMP